MVRISIQAAHEQVNPTNLLHDVIYMDQNGIGRCWTSDHHMLIILIILKSDLPRCLLQSARLISMNQYNHSDNEHQLCSYV
jgi:hypothetical protein